MQSWPNNNNNNKTLNNPHTLLDFSSALASSLSHNAEVRALDEGGRAPRSQCGREAPRGAPVYNIPDIQISVVMEGRGGEGTEGGPQRKQLFRSDSSFLPSFLLPSSLSLSVSQSVSQLFNLEMIGAGSRGRTCLCFFQRRLLNKEDA